MKKLSFVDRHKFILGMIEDQLKELAASWKLSNAVTESWRWDVPAVNLTWTSDDRIHRNIIVLLEVEPPLATASVEINAWIDEDDLPKEKKLRHSQHAQTARLHVAGKEALRQELELAYKKVSAWDRGKLKRKKHMPVHSPVLRKSE